MGRLPRCGKSRTLRVIVRAACADERVDLNALELLRQQFSPHASDADNWTVLACTVPLGALLEALQVACNTVGVDAAPATALAVQNLLELCDYSHDAQARELQQLASIEVQLQKERQAFLEHWADA